MSEVDDVLRVFARAAPGERLDRFALLRAGLDERSVSIALRTCAARGLIVEHGFSAELTEAGQRAIAVGTRWTS